MGSRRAGERVRVSRALVTVVAGLAGLAVGAASTVAETASPGPPEPVCGEVATLGEGPGDGPTVAAAVYELQLGLRLLQHFPYPLDGRYDPHTREAVRAFQQEAGLPADGVAGPGTWAALARAFRRQAAQVVASQIQLALQAPAPAAIPHHPDARPDGYWIVIDTNHLTLTLFQAGRAVHRWPVAVGKPSTITPVGEWRVARKSRDWGGGFGTRWLGLDVPWGIYGIHGTNKPWSIGTRASSGCIRMFNENVEQLWDLVPEGTPVTIIGVQPEARWDESIPAGAAGWNVPVLQWRLRQHGFDPGRADGRLGEGSVQAVQEAQIVLGLTPDDGATPDLFRALGLEGR